MSYPQIISLVCVFLYSILVGFSRLYLRVHSWNQIVYGWQLGIWAAFYFHFGLRESIISHINSLTTCETFRRETCVKYLVTSTIFYGVSLGILWLTYILSTVLNKPEDSWTQQIMSKCPSKVFGVTKFYCDESIVLSGICSIAYGAYLGFVFYR